VAEWVVRGALSLVLVVEVVGLLVNVFEQSSEFVQLLLVSLLMKVVELLAVVLVVEAVGLLMA